MILLASAFFISCNSEMKNFSYTIAENNKLNHVNLKKLKDAEKALLSWYLFAYGNECHDDINKVKCQLLNHLNISNECDQSHLEFLEQWLSNNKLILYKLKKCPVLPTKGVIQNKIDQIVLSRDGDIITIFLKAIGLNNSEEKTWDIEQTESYIIDGNRLIKQDEK